MKFSLRALILIAILFALSLSACAPDAEPEDENKPVTLESIDGTDLNRLTLSEKAAERLGLEIATVQTQQIDGAERLVVPYAALLYDPSGGAWVYVNVSPLVFVREAISVDFIEGDAVVLFEGPKAGSSVVTMGATELFGSESEFEEE
jgi:hypothetical protein